MAIKKTPVPKTAPAAKKKVSVKKAPAPVKKAAAKPAAAKKAAPARKKTAPRKPPVATKRASARNVSPEAVSPEQRYRMIATMAYFRAEQRGFEPGWETHDWLESEKEVDEMLQRRQKS